MRARSCSSRPAGVKAGAAGQAPGRDRQAWPLPMALCHGNSTGPGSFASASCCSGRVACGLGGTMSGNERALHLRVEERRGGTKLERAVVFGPGEPGRLWYEIEGDVLPPPIELLDAVVPAFLFRAMRQGCALRVHGPVSTRLLANLEEFQAAWACWRPDLYRPVEILPDREVAAPPAADESAVVAFSGGLDSLFSTWRHRPGSPPPGRARRWSRSGCRWSPSGRTGASCSAPSGPTSSVRPWPAACTSWPAPPAPASSAATAPITAWSCPGAPTR